MMVLSLVLGIVLTTLVCGRFLEGCGGMGNAHYDDPF